MCEYGWHLMGSDDAAWVPSPCLCRCPKSVVWGGLQKQPNKKEKLSSLSASGTPRGPGAQEPRVVGRPREAWGLTLE